jgi:threonine dehydrogenase-like Zn-dependent dehydrogenase
VVDADAVHRVPDGISAEPASFVQLGVIAACALDRSGLGPGDSAVVLGQGVIGQLLAQMAAARGAEPVISVARTDRRANPALARGAGEVVILERDGDKRLRDLDASVVFDATGGRSALPTALTAVGDSGTIVIAGSPREASEPIDFGELADKRVKILGVHAGRLLQPPDEEWRLRAAGYAETFLRLVSEGKLDLGPMISERVHPWEADWFYRRLARAEDATVVAIFDWELLDEKERLRRVSYVTAPDLTPITGARKLGAAA